MARSRKPRFIESDDTEVMMQFWYDNDEYEKTRSALIEVGWLFQFGWTTYAFNKDYPVIFGVFSRRVKRN